MDLMTLAAKITLDAGAYEKGLKNAEKGMDRFGKALSAKTVALGTFAGNMLTKATTASFNAISRVVKNATKAYADYEQLTGGVKTLFGTRDIKNANEYAKQIGFISEKVDKAGNKIVSVNKKMAKTLFGDTKGMTADAAIGRAYEQAQVAQERVFTNAKQAYLTTGMSANKYMETAMNFSASLVKSTGGDTLKAADLTQTAIQDIADNANKFGTDRESVENAYRGLAKGQYNMLDNLQLGYGGSKSGMQQLLKDASKLTGQKYKMGNMADMINAIHAIQENMGITGTTEKEAKGTIQGSKQMLGAAWENVLTALAAPEDLDLSGAIASLTDSAKTYLDNLFPVVSTVMDGLGDFISEILPDIMEKLPEMIADFAPKLIKAGKKMFQSFGRGLKNVFKQIPWPTWDDVKGTVSNAWQTITKGFDKLGKLIFGEKADGTTNWPTAGEIIAKIQEIWGEVVKAFDDLGAIIFGKKADGTTDWPTAEEIFQTIKRIWDDVLKLAESLVPMIFGENSAISDALTNAIHFIQDFGDWVTEHWEEVKDGLAAIGAAIAAWQIVEIASSLSPLKLALYGIIIVLALIAANWDIIKQKIADFNEYIETTKTDFALWCTENLGIPLANFIKDVEEAPEKVKNVFVNWAVGEAVGFINWVNTNLINPVNDFISRIRTAIAIFRELLGLGPKEIGTGGKLSDDQVNGLMQEYENNKERKRSNVLTFGSDPEGKAALTAANAEIDTEFAELLGVEMTKAGAKASEVDAAVEKIKSGEITPEDMEDFIKSLGDATDNMDGLTDSAEESAEAVSAVVEGVNSLHDKTYTITQIIRTIHIGSGVSYYNKNSAGAKKVNGFVVQEAGVKDDNSSIGSNAKGDWSVPYDDYITRLHRGEMVLTKSQARQYREGNSGNIDIAGLAASIVAAVREGMAGASVNSYLDGRNVTKRVNRRNTNTEKARRFVTA